MQVIELLEKHKIQHITSGKDVLVKCLNPKHEDNNPSMRIDKITGIFNCFSCGFKGNIFKHFDEPIDWLSTKRNIVKEKINNKIKESISLILPNDITPYVGTWRGISEETYNEFKAFEYSDSEFVGRIWFPIYDFTEDLVALIGRHTTDGTPKYMIKPTGAKLPLYPKALPINGRVVLVEGIFDMLNLYDKGIKNVISCFGVNTVTSNKLSLLKVRGIVGIDIFFDGDEAGQKGATKLKKLVEDEGLFCRNIYYPDKDPGELTLEQVKKLKEKLLC